MLSRGGLHVVNKQLVILITERDDDLADMGSALHLPEGFDNSGGVIALG